MCLGLHSLPYYNPVGHLLYARVHKMNDLQDENVETKNGEGKQEVNLARGDL